MFEVHVDTIEAGAKKIHVVRDDLLGGGTKERACRPFLESLMRLGYREFLYASPFCGFAQVALAKSARSLGVRCTIFAERSPQGLAHEFTELARLHGADIALFDTLPEASAAAAQAERDAFVFREIFADGSSRVPRASVLNLPLGFDHEDFRAAFRVALQTAWSKLSGLGVERVWLPVGSGTLARTVRAVVPSHIELSLVDVGVLAETDSRIRSAASLPNTRYFRSPESFFDAAVVRPPIPSNKHYDAKLWRFLVENAAENDLWWNVAR